MSKKEKFAQPWKEFASRWQKYYTPPGRPSKSAVKVYKDYTRKAIKGVKSPRVLILGSTPELRDLLYELKVEVTFVDMNLEMILAMSELMKHKNPNEIIVRCNWVKTPLASNYYDVVLGDLVSSNVPRKLQNKFLGEMVRILKPEGYFITKHSIVPENWAFKDADNIIKMYEPFKFYRSEPLELFCHLLINIWDQKTKIQDCKKVKKAIQKYKKKGRYYYPNSHIKKAMNNIWIMWAPLDKRWSIDWGSDAEKKIAQYFKITKKIILKDCKYREINESFPIWICRVKK